MAGEKNAAELENTWMNVNSAPRTFKTDFIKHILTLSWSTSATVVCGFSAILVLLICPNKGI